MKDLGLDSCSLMRVLLCFIPFHISLYACIQFFIHLGMLSWYDSTIIMETITNGLYLPQMWEDVLMLTGIKPWLDCLLWSALHHSVSSFKLTALEWLKSSTRKNNLYVLVELLLSNVHMHVARYGGTISQRITSLCLFIVHKYMSFLFLH